MRSQRIAHLFSDPGPFATAYIDLSQDHENARAEVDLGVRAACDALEEGGAPPGVVETLREHLAVVPEGPAPLSRFVVATERGLLLDDVTRTRRTVPTASWSPVPDLSEWLSDQIHNVPFVLAVVDHEGGAVTAHPDGVFGPAETTETGGETDFEHKVPGGGWAHLKWQHYNESVWARNARRVAETIRGHVDHGIDLVLLAGEVQSRAEVVGFLEGVNAEVMEIDAGGRNADGSDEVLRTAVGRALEEAVETARVEEVDTLQERLGRGEAVSIGVGDTLDAFVRGQVDRLLIDPRAAAEIDVQLEHHPGLVLGATAPPPEMSADRALVAAAAATAADIDIVPSSMLSGAPAAALLRWHQMAEGARA